MMKARVIPSQPEIAVLYHFKETQQEGAVLRELLSQHHIEACSLPEEALGQTVASFLAGEPPVAGKQAPYPGQVIVFSGVAAQKQQGFCVPCVMRAWAGRRSRQWLRRQTVAGCWNGCLQS